MLTPHLERLIWEGQAAFDTFVVGGTEKHILSVKPDTWTIITGITYFPRLAGATFDEWSLNRLTQLNVFSRDNFNNFLFRNNYTAADLTGTTAPEQAGFNGTPITLDVYLIHERDIAFTFSNGQQLSPITAGTTESDTISAPLPLDYGNAADPGALPVQLSSRTDPSTFIYFGGDSVPRVAGARSFKQLQFPVNAANQLTNISNPHSMPIALISYVSISGSKPANIRVGA